MCLDDVIRYGRFSDFVTHHWERHQDGELMRIWLHKCLDKSFEDWKAQLKPKAKPTKRQIEATVKKSAAIAQAIRPDDM